MAYLNGKKLFMIVRTTEVPVNYQIKTITPSNFTSVVLPDSGYGGLSKVVINGILVDPHYSYTTYSDSTIAYTKTVPTGALDIANIDRVGGLSYKCLNLWDEQWEIGSYDTTTGAKDDTAPTRIRSTNSIKILPSTTYYFEQSTQTGGTYRIFQYTSDGTYINNIAIVTKGTFTTDATAVYIRFQCADGYGKTYNNDICINVSDSAINGSYYPYFEGLRNVFPTSIDVQDEDGYDFTDIIAYVQAQGYDLSLSTSSTLYNYVDLENKKAVINVASVDLGTLDWTMSGVYFGAGLSRMKNDGYNTVLLCSKYPTAYSQAQFVDKTISGVPVFSVKNVVVRDSDYSNATAFKQGMSGVMLNYELATPIEIDLSNLIVATTINVSTGILYFENEFNYAVPSFITYLLEV